MKEKIAKWYNMGLWDIEKVKQAVEKGIIITDDFFEIIGKKYA